ncbi:Alpha/beta hydrolase family protein [Planctomycetes bacterium Poly30]|uniref:Alpha/beta hydrolase family protein n=1 Tax=Saltatorellus ferox TaxID=2528018 RepID=A0A518ETP4_9BACT|nr:Alpha/beta hydrolase family protein [Planctomycetes bacterium Poly30]
MVQLAPALAVLVLSFLSGLAAASAAQNKELPRPGEVFAIDGHTAFVIEPEEAARRPGPMPWVWYAPTLEGLPAEEETWMFDRFLAAGIAVAGIDVGESYGNPEGRAAFQALYESLTTERGLARRPVLLARSRGGLMLYGWAVEHPESVGAVAGIYPVCNLVSYPGLDRAAPAFGMSAEALGAALQDHNPIEKLAALARAGVPVLHIHGDADTVVPLDANSALLAERYATLGGPVEIAVIEGRGHDMWSGWFRSQKLTDFAVAHALANQGLTHHDRLVVRGTLENCRARFEGAKRGRVAFLGGSITHNPGWRDEVCAYLRERFPKTEFDFLAAGNPSMGSTPGAFRFTRDVLSHGPVDLLFQEAAVNDSTNGRSAVEMVRGTEGIVRQALRSNPAMDVVLLHFVDPDKMATYRAGEVPLVIEQHEAVAERYGLSSVNLAWEVTERIDASEFTWEDDFKNLHPSPFGQQLYAASVLRLLSKCWDGESAVPESPTPHGMPAALDPFSYDAARLVPLKEATTRAGFELVPDCDPRQGGIGGGVRDGFVDVPMLVATKPGDQLTLPFEGRAVGLWVAAGPDAGTIEHRIDGGPWRTTDLFTPWSGGLHLPWVHVLEAELDGAAHRLEVRIAATKNERSRGHAVRIARFLVND